MSMKSFLSKWVLAGAAMIFATVAMAQDISSKVRGTVTDNSGAAISDATITIRHEPSGTQRSVQTGSSGEFLASGLRVGGPYTIEVTAPGHRGEKYENVYLSVSDPAVLTASLDSSTVDEIVVVASAVPQTDLTGTASQFSEQFINDSAAFNRDLKEIVQRNPLATILPGGDAPLTIAGQNPRYNSLTVDGVSQNDDFGLNDNGYPTQRAPISLEAVEQLSVDVSPFSPRYSGFSGGQINAVTRSGGNQFHGSIFYENLNDSWAGTPETPDGDEVDITFDEKTLGGFLSGPIIKDKLFFLVSYEKFEEERPIEWGPAGSGAPNETDITEADLNQVLDIARSVYGVEPGDWNVSPIEEDEKILVKLDWNINDQHRAALTYQRTEGNIARNLTNDNDELKLSSHWYNKAETLETITAHLFSDWSDSFSTEFKVVNKTVDTVQAAGDLSFGDITVTTASGDVALGPDRFRHANALDNKTTQFVLHGDYIVGNHVIGAGIDYTQLDIFNLFAPASLGVWEFDNIADFQAQVAGDFEYENALSNNSSDAAATFNMDTLAFYIEDRWQVNDSLELAFGVRFETISAGDSPLDNPNFNARYGFSNTENLDGADNILPRFGFNWDVADQWRLYGGIGMYSGGRPNVWISNSYSNNGITYTTFDTNAVDPDDYLTNVDVTAISQSVQGNLLVADGNTNAIEPGFEIPSDWRYKFGVEYILGDGYQFNLDFLRIESEESMHWVDLGRVPSTDINGNVVRTADGGRVIYTPFDPLNPLADSNRHDLLLTNASGGTNDTISLSFRKDWNNGLSIFASYAHQNTEEGNPGTSSTASSNFQFNGALDRQFPTYGPTSFEIEHRFTIDLRYRKAFWGEYETGFNLFWSRRSGTPWTWALGAFRDGDLGDQTDFDDSDYYLPYIPSGPDDPAVAYTGGGPFALDYDTLLEQLQIAGLEQYAGGYVPKNTGRTPWITRLDLRIDQEIPGFSKEHRGVVYLEILNLLNLFDDDSGKVLRNRFSTSSRILVDYDVNDQGQYVYSVPFCGAAFGGNPEECWNTDANWDRFESAESTWRMKLGIRYRF